MERNTSNIKKRILLYADSKGYSRRKIYSDTGMANGILSQKSGITEDNIERFVSTYGDINLIWLITGQGEMLKGASEKGSTPVKEEREVRLPALGAKSAENCNACLEKERIIVSKVELLEAKNEIIENLKEKIEFLESMLPSKQAAG